MANSLQQQPDILQPHSVEAEESLLGSILIDNSALLQIAKFIGQKDFFVERNGWIFSAIKELSNQGKPSDLVTLSDELERRGQLMELGGSARLTELVGCVPTSIHAKFYAEIVAEKAKLRRAIDVAGKVARMAYDEQNNADEVVDRAMELMRGVKGTPANGGLRHYGDALFGQCDRVDEIMTSGLPVGVASGLVDYDDKMGGFQRCDMIVFMARPGVGKTSLAITCGVNAAKMGFNVGIFTLEMSEGQLCQRILSMESELDTQRIRRGDITIEESMLLNKCASELSALPIFIDDTPAISLEYLRAESIRVHAESGLDLIILDYLQLMTGDGGNREQEVAKVSKGIKQLAKELNIPIIACAQINRQVESRADKRPMLADLRESGSIEMDADVVVGIYRDEKYNEDTEFPNIAELIVLKHRNGNEGKVNVFFKKQTTKFDNLVIKANPMDY